MRALSICKSKLARAGAALAISASFALSEDFFFFFPPLDKKHTKMREEPGKDGSVSLCVCVFAFLIKFFSPKCFISTAIVVIAELASNSSLL